MRRARPWIASGALGLPASLALAADPAPLQGSTAGALFQALLGLLVVLAVLYAFFWLLRRYVPLQSGAQGVVKVVGGVMLGPREKVVVVEVGDTWLLLGVASGQVNTLHTLPRPEGYKPVEPVPLPSFAGKLNEILARRKR